MGAAPAAGVVSLRPGRPSVLARPDLPPALARRADRHGVATWYRSQSGQPLRVPRNTVEAVLDAMGAGADSPAGAAQLAPPVVVTRAGATALVDLHPPGVAPVEVTVERADGGSARVPTRAGGNGVTAVLANPPPVGWHTLRVSTGGRSVSVPLAVAPYRLPPAPRGWGWSLQLYALRASEGWGVGDFSVLRRLASADDGADFVLINPVHAAATVPPMQPSPYTPASRRFVHPLYLRVEETNAYRRAPAALREEVDALRPPVAGDRIDRDRTWAALEPALRLLWRSARRPGASPRPGPDAAALEGFATWCAIAARHGADYRRWPEGLRHPDAPAVRAFREGHRDDVAFHTWCQERGAEQLAAAQRDARRAGKRIGVLHDLAVGVDPGGADAWALQDVLASGISVGAPPDDFNQQGQDWGLPPWQPEALRRAAYRPFRDMVRAVLAHGGGVRVDHVLGLFRLWWVPQDASPSSGTYVRYPAADLLGVLTLEAALAGAVVVGEDLGTVEPRVERDLAARGVLGTSVLWFERDGRHPRPPARWRRDALAAVTTHDLPTAAGFLRLEHVRLRAELGLLSRSADAERAAARRERDQLVAMLEAEGLVPPGADTETLIVGMYAALARTPARLLTAYLPDAVADPRQPNLPGTVDEYPNWSLPVAAPDRSGALRPLTLEGVLAHPGFARLARILREGLAGGSGSVPAGDEPPVLPAVDEEAAGRSV